MMNGIHSGCRTRGLRAGLIVLFVSCAVLPAAAAEGTPHFTAKQVADGRAVYAASCVNCHGVNLEGGAGRALTGGAFTQAWGGHAVGDFYNTLTTTMPPNAPHSLSEREYLAVTAYVLSRNGYVAGETALAAAGLVAPILSVQTAAAQDGQAAASPQMFPMPPATVQHTAETRPSDAELRAVTPENWLTYGRTLDGQRYSPLGQINAANVAQLRPACILQLGEVGSFQANPVVYDGKIYVTSRYKTFALNGATCVPLWQHVYVPPDPDVAISAARGVALYRGRVFRGTSDGHLLALDAANGKLLWDVRVNDSHVGYSTPAAPVAFDGKVFIGEAGGDSGTKGHVYAFDADDGRLIWMFDVIPTGDQFGAKTWSGGTEHGGGAVWSSMSIDPVRGLLLVPTGNPGPDYNAATRRGDNLFTDSIVALDVKSGKLAWYVQQVPNDVHDWDTAAPPAIYDRGTKAYMAVADKDGYLYIYDRNTRKLLAKPELMSPHVNTDVPFNYTTPVVYCPGIHGQYFGAAYAPEAGALFVGSEYRCSGVQLQEEHFVAGQTFYGGRNTYPQGDGTGFIRGFDAESGKLLWDYHSPVPINAGVSATAGGLVLAGDRSGYFLVLDAKTGAVLYQFMTGGAIAGGNAVYAVDGKEYIAVVSGNSSRALAAAFGAATLVVFSLP